MNMKQGGSWDMRHHPPMPRPKNDDGYFEEMTKVVPLCCSPFDILQSLLVCLRR